MISYWQIILNLFGCQRNNGNLVKTRDVPTKSTNILLPCGVCIRSLITGLTLTDPVPIGGRGPLTSLNLLNHSNK